MKSRAGWRIFECDGCGLKWKEKSRDMFSPSGVDCKCGEWCSAVGYSTSPPVKTDNNGNLLSYETIILEER